ncbi:inhibitor of growth protein [Anaeramoeba flamelloides]|uniref:Inhibitor of growth protein n=1 Tax=Anaeramoeba flamelloides TaxID=1746091 RepID=A0ABQ8YE97_9EUKA|nr:inhibitor of growth protein [Anaeramoeba flamelloides]
MNNYWSLSVVLAEEAEIPIIFLQKSKYLSFLIKDKPKENYQSKEETSESESESESEEEEEEEGSSYSDKEEEFDSEDGDEANWCCGKEKPKEKWVQCENAKCPKKWFHLGCVGLERVPKGKWYCDQCKKKGVKQEKEKKTTRTTRKQGKQGKQGKKGKKGKKVTKANKKNQKKETKTKLRSEEEEGGSNYSEKEEEFDSEDGDESNWCCGKEKPKEKWVQCENAKCPKKWFHLGCVGLERVPKGKWYCDQCKKKHFFFCEKSGNFIPRDEMTVQIGTRCSLEFWVVDVLERLKAITPSMPQQYTLKNLQEILNEKQILKLCYRNNQTKTSNVQKNDNKGLGIKKLYFCNEWNNFYFVGLHLSKIFKLKKINVLLVKLFLQRLNLITSVVWGNKYDTNLKNFKKNKKKNSQQTLQKFKLQTVNQLENLEIQFFQFWETNKSVFEKWFQMGDLNRLNVNSNDKEKTQSTNKKKNTKPGSKQEKGGKGRRKSKRTRRRKKY